MNKVPKIGLIGIATMNIVLTDSTLTKDAISITTEHLPTRKLWIRLALPTCER